MPLGLELLTKYRAVRGKKLQTAAVTLAKQYHCQDHLSAVCSLAYYNYIKRQACSFNSSKMTLPVFSRKITHTA